VHNEQGRDIQLSIQNDLQEGWMWQPKAWQKQIQRKLTEPVYLSKMHPLGGDATKLGDNRFQEKLLADWQ
jgi:hypothetical protein